MIAKPIPDFEGGLEALRTMTDKLRAGVPQCHVRFADGEFYSILGRTGPNADGQEHLPETLGRELDQTLRKIAWAKDPNVTVGGDWRLPANAWNYLQQNGLAHNINWTPPQVFVSGMVRHDTLDFLRAVKDHKGTKVLIANDRVRQAIAGPMGLSAMTVLLSSEKDKRGAYDSMAYVRRILLSSLAPGSVVLWCAGLGCKPALYDVFKTAGHSSHFDLGAFFDLASGVQSRTWMTEPPDARGWCYRREYMPRLSGEMPW